VAVSHPLRGGREAITGRMAFEGVSRGQLGAGSSQTPPIPQWASSLAGHVSDAILVTDGAPAFDHLAIVYANPAFAASSGYDTDELIGRSPLIMFGPKSDPEMLAELAHGIQGGQSVTCELVTYRKNGSDYWAQWLVSPIRDEAGAIVQWVSVIRDTTQHKREETQLKRQNGFLAALHDMTVGLLNRFEVEHMFDTVVEQMCALLNCQHGYIALVSDDGQRLVTTASCGAIPGDVPDAPRQKGEGLSGKVWETGQPIWLANYGEWRGHVSDLSVPYPVAVAPLKSEGEVVGVIGMVRTEYHEPFAEDEIDLLLRFGQLAALVYDNSRLYHAVQRQLSERTQIEAQLRTQNGYLDALHSTTLGLINGLDVQALLQSVLAQAASLLGTPHGFLDLIDEFKETTISFAGVGYFAAIAPRELSKGEGLAGRVWATGQPVLIEDYDAWEHRSPQVEFGVVRAVLGVPLKMGGKVVGIISLSHADLDHSFSPEQVVLLDRLAQLASVAYHNAQLYEAAQRELAERRRVEAELRRQTAYLAALNETTLGLINGLDVHELLHSVLRQACDLFRAQMGFVDLADDGRGVLHSFSRIGFTSADPVLELHKGEGLSGKVWAAGQTIVVADYDTWPGRSPAVQPGSAHASIHATIGVPLTSKGRIAGVLGLARLSPGDVFTTEEADLLNRLAQLASVAYDNAALYDAVKANEQALESRVAERTRDLTRALEENEALRAKTAQDAATAERSRLARELHDSVSQAIYGIVLGVRTMQHLSRLEPEKLTEPLSYIVSLANAALAEIRALIFELRPESLEQEGILAALHKQADALGARYGLTLVLDLPEREPGVTIDVKEALYRIALEATHNTVKHAEATRIMVRLTEDAQAIHLTVADNGRGFDRKEVRGGHLGLTTMQERVAALGGQFALTSVPAPDPVPDSASDLATATHPAETPTENPLTDPPTGLAAPPEPSGGPIPDSSSMQSPASGTTIMISLPRQARTSMQSSDGASGDAPAGVSGQSSDNPASGRAGK